MNVVITGITSGLGEALVSQFKKDINLKIIGIYKDKKKLKFSSSKNLVLIKCDFSKKSQVYALVKKIKKYKTIDCLINNHAVLGGYKHTSKELFYINYLSIQELTFKLLKNLYKSKKKLVVNISSHAHNIDLSKKKLTEMSNWQTYKLSKLCLIILSKKLATIGLNSISINPGRMRTNFGKDNFFKIIIKLYLFIFGKNPNSIAKKIYKIINSKKYRNGCYYSNFKIKKMHYVLNNYKQILKFLNFDNKINV